MLKEGNTHPTDQRVLNNNELIKTNKITAIASGV